MKYPEVNFETDGLTVAKANWELMTHHRVGDIIRLNGSLVRITKKSNFAFAFEPYTLGERVENAILGFLGFLRP